MKVVCVIPARYGSTRLKKKMLLSVDGKPLLWHTWQKALRCGALDDVAIAVDDERLRARMAAFGATVYMTSRAHRSGTDRVAEVARRWYKDADIIVNLQGDEPLMASGNIALVVRALKKDPLLDIATVKLKMTGAGVDDPNVVKVVTDARDHALYFSRAAIPFYRDRAQKPVYYKHLGIYGYRRKSLFAFTGLEPSALEQKEKLEQLRALEAGMRIKVLTTRRDSIGVDTKKDLMCVKKIIQKL